MTDDPTATFTRARAAAGVLFFNEHDHIMLVDPSYKDHRDIPGGYVEHGETPARLRNVKLLKNSVSTRRLGGSWSPTGPLTKPKATRSSSSSRVAP
nr:NUDIX hydrolase [Actinomadura luteofluorescens]